MPLFDYSGFNAAGRKVSGTIEGSGNRMALQQLKAQGIVATSLVRQTGTIRSRRDLLAVFRQPRVPVMEVAAATRQLATLLGAGIPLDEAVATVAGQQENAALLKALNATREELLQGQALHEGLAEHRRIFSDLYVNMVKVGESSGTLDQVMQRLADFLEEQARLRSRIQSAMAYPLLMAVIGTGVLFFLLTFVVPKVTRMLQDIGQELPPADPCPHWAERFSLLLLVGAGADRWCCSFRYSPLPAHRAGKNAVRPAQTDTASDWQTQPAAVHGPLYPNFGNVVEERRTAARRPGNRPEPYGQSGAQKGTGRNNCRGSRR